MDNLAARDLLDTLAGHDLLDTLAARDLLDTFAANDRLDILANLTWFMSFIESSGHKMAAVTVGFSRL